MDTLRKIDKFLDNYLSKFECESIGLHNDFFCYPNTREIAYSFMYCDNADVYFNKLFKKLGLQYNADAFVLAFYHEIGHCMTWQKFNKIELFIVKALKKWVENGKLTEFKKKLYVVLPDEYKATQWACRYINKHPREVKYLCEKLFPLILQYYKELGLVE